MHSAEARRHSHLLTPARIDVGIVETPSLLEHGTLFSSIKGGVLGCGSGVSTDHCCIRVAAAVSACGAAKHPMQRDMHNN